MSREFLDLSQQQTRTTQQLAATPDLCLRVPGLVIVGHPDWRRVGEEVALPQLVSGTSVDVSRLEPTFALPGGDGLRPLDDAYLSRSPIRLSPGPEPGSVSLARGASRIRVWWQGTEIETSRTFSAADVEEGVVLVLSRRVTLLLHLVDPVPSDLPHHGLVGESGAALRLRQEISSAAKLDLPVLLRGETGTGKELVARALHDGSRRRHGPFRAVSMAALPASLAAAELFGAFRGAYTGADSKKRGFFQSAAGGTLFLDEIGEAPIEVQVMLLRALETGEIQPLGSAEPMAIDVHVVAATDADLEAAIDAGRFRAPLLHRLAGYDIYLPSLRQRRDDVARLLFHFLAEEAATGNTMVGVAQPETASAGEGDAAAQSHSGIETAEQVWPPAEQVARLLGFHWPGNVRQLRNVARRMAILRQESRSEQDLCRLIDQLLAGSPAMKKASSAGPQTQSSGNETGAQPSRPSVRRAATVQESELLRALEVHQWQPTAAASALGISRSALYRLMAASSSIRKASELDSQEIQEAIQSCRGNPNTAALRLRVSPQGLKRRMKALDLD